MKKVIFTLLLITGTLMAFSQTSYYWVGGASGSFSTPANWNTALNGSGTPLAASPSTTESLIFDGSNIGGATPTTGTVTPNISSSFTIAQLKLQNAADVVFYRFSSTGTPTGTSTFTIAGDGTPSDDFTMDATSALKITAITYSTAQSFAFVIGALSTGTVNGTIRVMDGGFAKSYISVLSPSSLFFANGSNCYANNTFAASYPLASSGGATINGGIVFQSGSSLIYQGGNSVFTTTGAAIPMTFATGSNFIVESALPGASPNTFNKHFFSNVIIRNNATVNADGAFYNVDNLTVNAGAIFNLAGTGGNSVTGNLLNNGTMGNIAGATTGQLVMTGTSPQTVGGTGTFNPFCGFSVSTDADVTLNTNLAIGSGGPPTSNISGKLNVQNFTISSTGTTLGGPISFKSAATATSSPSKTYAGAFGDTLANAIAYAAANVSVGNLVTGTGIQPNTYIIATNSGSFSFTLSKPATQTNAGGTITISNGGASLATSSPTGVDGNITTTGTRTFSSGASYIFNAATSAPFSDVSNAGASASSNNVTFNAPATTNRVITINGVLTLNTGKLTIRPVDTVHLSTSGSIAGTFNTSKYIATDVSGANVGVLKIDSFTTTKTYPVGTPTYYMPVTLTPATVSSFCVSLFQGVTTDGTPTGPAFTPTQKSGIVDAVWTINRATANTDNCTVTINWDAALEGASFQAYGNNIGIGRYDGVSWTTVGGTGDNTLNTATNTFSNFSPFGIGQLNTTLPIRLYNFSAKADQGKVKLQWNVSEEGNTANYSIERSVNGTSFVSIANVSANGSNLYAGVDASPSASIVYYRIKLISKTGSFEYSSIIKVKLNDSKPGLSIFPNPVQNNLLNLQMDNFSADKVQLKLYNNNGQLLLNDNIQYNGGSQVQQIQLPPTVVKGVYRLVINANNEILKRTIIVQ